jgi:hypothetical protein
MPNDKVVSRSEPGVMYDIHMEIRGRWLHLEGKLDGKIIDSMYLPVSSMNGIHQWLGINIKLLEEEKHEREQVEAGA